MTEQTLIAILATIAALGGAGLTYLTAAQARTARKLARLAAENRALWYYTRHLIDWGYRPHGASDRPPEPPESISHLYEFGEPT